MQFATQKTHTYPRTFEKARDAVLTLKLLRPLLSSKEAETLSLLLDSDAMATIEKSGKEAAAGEFEPLDEAIE